MRLDFLGTRANIAARSRRHRRHSALMVTADGVRLMIDCGADWLDRVAKLRPDAIVLTHAHPDHAGGLAHGAPCPVWASAESWQGIARIPVRQRQVFERGETLHIGPFAVKAVAVEHSARAPAVGLRFSTSKAAFFYVPDVALLPDAPAALGGIDLYVGDGSTLIRPILRRRDGALHGHAPVRTQLKWCRDAGVGRALFTHCGSQIVTGDERKLGPRLRAIGRTFGVDARIAYDGLLIELP